MEDQPLVIHRRQRNCETQQIAMDRVNAERRQAAEKRRQEREAQRQERQLKKKVTAASDAFEKSQSIHAEDIEAMMKVLQSTTWVTSGTATTTPFPSITTGGAISGYYDPGLGSPISFGDTTWSVTINGEPAMLKSPLGNGYITPGHVWTAEYLAEQTLTVDDTTKTCNFTTKKL